MKGGRVGLLLLLVATVRCFCFLWYDDVKRERFLLFATVVVARIAHHSFPQRQRSAHGRMRTKTDRFARGQVKGELISFFRICSCFRRHHDTLPIARLCESSAVGRGQFCCCGRAKDRQWIAATLLVGLAKDTGREFLDDRAG